MAVLNCKKCGAPLQAAEDMTVCECEYCGSKQTIPKTRDDITANLFNRANNLRIKCEFDKAQEIYEKIVANNPTEAEAYWGIILCKYGIEYVEDPATLAKVPTCHRTQLESVQTDVDYQSALEYADIGQRIIYEQEARAIDGLQKNILEIVHKEKPFDVFICYKETGADGKRTTDSVFANDIYHQLTQEGFKVFYAAITLEDKLGREYEPYIFAALNSAKVMLVIGTKPEYFSAVWVKNEWSRYLKIMKNDRSKLLIPCYKDMDAYDLPEEFSHLQAQDMSKIGFINDIIRGIKKVIVKEEKPKTVQTAPAPSQESGDPLLERAFLFLEDRKWEEANDYLERALDQNPKNARAYLGKLMAELYVSSESALNQIRCGDISERDYYQKTYRFGDAALKEKLEQCNKHSIYNEACYRMKAAKTDSDFFEAQLRFYDISDFSDARQKASECAEKAKEYLYAQAVAAMQKAVTDEEYRAAAAMFRDAQISGYKDVAEQAEACENQAMMYLYGQAMTAMHEAKTENAYKAASAQFKKLGDFRDAAQLAEKCLTMADETREKAQKDAAFDNAARLLNRASSKEELQKAQELFASLCGYRDADACIEKCRNKILELEKSEAEKRRQLELATQRAKKRARQKKALMIGIPSGIVAVVLGAVMVFVVIPEKQRADAYRYAMEQLENENYEEAITVFMELGDYKDAVANAYDAKIMLSLQQKEQQYQEAVTLYENGSYEEAIAILRELEDYEGAAEMIEEIYENHTIEMLSTFEKGDIITLGGCNWIVLRTNVGRTDGTKAMLVVSEDVVEHMPYHDDKEAKNVAWETCSLRAWLNEEFYNEFSEVEKEYILDTDYENVTDKVFLLSASQARAEVYFESEDDRAILEQYWIRHNESQENTYIPNEGTYMPFVDSYGDISSATFTWEFGVRPAMWLSVE